MKHSESKLFAINEIDKIRTINYCEAYLPATMRQPTWSSQRNSKHKLKNNKNKQKSKPSRQSSRTKTPINTGVATTTTKNDAGVDRSRVLNNTNTKEEDLRVVM